MHPVQVLLQQRDDRGMTEVVEEDVHAGRQRGTDATVPRQPPTGYGQPVDASCNAALRARIGADGPVAQLDRAVPS